VISYLVVISSQTEWFCWCAWGFVQGLWVALFFYDGGWCNCHVSKKRTSRSITTFSNNEW